MTLREKFLAIKTREEWESRREEFRQLRPDKELLRHLDSLYPDYKCSHEELYKTPGSHCPGK
ncbi:MAG: hypothetical protein IJ079_03865 [Lachnospiraceae bacterium]|nr:hypothetical protein [Lachnospiraceae bacterium]MBR1567545.1 hypothetical protein [Lachnospiraceae bacterium]MBR1568701.1 hypothetical protein [Lachnospiraceae bacterium]